MCPVSSPDFLWVFLLSHLQHEEQISEELLGEHCRVLSSSRTESAFLDACVPQWDSGRYMRPSHTQSPLFWFFPLGLHWECPLFLFAVKIRTILEPCVDASINWRADVLSGSFKEDVTRSAVGEFLENWMSLSGSTGSWAPKRTVHWGLCFGLIQIMLEDTSVQYIT